MGRKSKVTGTGKIRQVKLRLKGKIKVNTDVSIARVCPDSVEAWITKNKAGGAKGLAQEGNNIYNQIQICV